jgi:hypothetical protein
MKLSSAEETHFTSFMLLSVLVTLEIVTETYPAWR